MQDNHRHFDLAECHAVGRKIALIAEFMVAAKTMRENILRFIWSL